jgi:hypothetical protein
VDPRLIFVDLIDSRLSTMDIDGPDGENMSSKPKKTFAARYTSFFGAPNSERFV